MTSYCDLLNRDETDFEHFNKVIFPFSGDRGKESLSGCRSSYIRHVSQRRVRSLLGLLDDAETPISLQHHRFNVLEGAEAYRTHSRANFGFRDPL